MGCKQTCVFLRVFRPQGLQDLTHRNHHQHGSPKVLMRRISFTSIPPWGVSQKLGDARKFVRFFKVTWGPGAVSCFQIEWKRLNAMFWQKIFLNKTSL